MVTSYLMYRSEDSEGFLPRVLKGFTVDGDLTANMLSLRFVSDAGTVSSMDHGPYVNYYHPCALMGDDITCLPIGSLHHPPPMNGKPHSRVVSVPRVMRI
jgi:hypothetical protein